MDRTVCLQRTIPYHPVCKLLRLVCPSSALSRQHPEPHFDSPCCLDHSGISQDGGDAREFGWQFWDPAVLDGWNETRTQSVVLQRGNGTENIFGQRCWVAQGVQVLRVYGTQLTTSELLQNFKAGPSADLPRALQPHPRGRAQQ